MICILSCGRRHNNGMLPLQLQLLIFLQVLEALEHAHSRGIFHCNLALHKIFLRADGTAVVSGWGCAVLGNDPISCPRCACRPSPLIRSILGQTGSAAISKIVMVQVHLALMGSVGHQLTLQSHGDEMMLQQWKNRKSGRT